MSVLNVLRLTSHFVSKYMAVIVIAMAMLALFEPGAVSFIKTSYVNTLLGIVMFGMGLTLKSQDFRIVFSHPKDEMAGTVLQFTIMPSMAWLLTKAFQFPSELAAGAILVGTCPRGAIPGAAFSVWHNVSGAILVNFFLRRTEQKKQD